MQLEDLTRLGRRGLDRMLCAGTEPAVEELVGWEFLGTVGSRSTRLLGLRRFVKAFLPAEGPGRARGYNVLCRQRDWSKRTFRGRELRHSHFVVRTGTGRHEGCVVLDYASSDRNPRWWPGRLFLDVLVLPDPEDTHLLLGKAYLRLGPRVPLAFFILERNRAIDPEAA